MVIYPIVESVKNHPKKIQGYHVKKLHINSANVCRVFGKKPATFVGLTRTIVFLGLAQWAGNLPPTLNYDLRISKSGIYVIFPSHLNVRDEQTNPEFAPFT